MSSFIDSIKSTSLSRALTIALGSNNFKSASTINDCKMGLYSSRLLAIPDNFSLVSSNIPSSDCSRAERTFNLILFAIVDLVICCESMAFFNLLLKLPSMLLVSFLTMLVFSISYSWSAFNWISFAFSSASFLDESLHLVQFIVHLVWCQSSNSGGHAVSDGAWPVLCLFCKTVTNNFSCNCYCSLLIYSVSSYRNGRFRPSPWRVTSGALLADTQ
ncbi:hypothetical protein AWRI1631_154820 [Saccharomyces cerevisiae AWRI1631]|uniref:Uncharacterized protein n=1 Tax=Saccharomyces cerevisiae (strain AWRI1631) TaxID=545124 RepID=B5VSL0_YEAS6|nr:hypothetical protein AWRI1631_154820 [Saccharomyces cerevisiae AWRI1631]